MTKLQNLKKKSLTLVSRNNMENRNDQKCVNNDEIEQVEVGTSVVTVSERKPNTKSNRYGPPPADDLTLSTDPSSLACGKVRKRNGAYEEISIAKIETRIKLMSRGLQVNPIQLARQVMDGVCDGITTREIDILAASFAHEKITDHPDYDVLAARLAVSNHQKETMAPFSEVMRVLHQANQIRDEFMNVVEANAERLDSAIDYDRDNLFTYFGFRTFEHSYSLTIAETDPATGKEVNKCYERPQHMYMRTALELHLDDIDAAIETYDWMSCQYFIHASPTLMNAGKKQNQMSSCFLVAMKEEKTGHKDSIRGIYQTLMNVALISASSGGIGLHCSTVRAEGSPITSAGRPSSGIIPMLIPYEGTAKYVDQGRKRKGAIAVYLEPWHADIEDFLHVKDNTTESKEWQESGKARMRDLHLALWIPDEFMRRVDQDADWSLMCPFYSPDLVDLYGTAFEERYRWYESQGWPYVRKTVKARTIWTAIVDSQIHTGEPYMLYKDAVNRKTNHQNLGTIKSSNLCVAPYTRILTRNGPTPISQLENQEIDIWNGFEWSAVTIRKTGEENKQLLRITLSNGSVLDCTPEHRFYLNPNGVEDPEASLLNATMVEASKLRAGDQLISFYMPMGDSRTLGEGVFVVSVSGLSDLHDTFCFTEEKRHLGMFEGVVTGQCSEIVQYSSSEKTAVCNLASISLKAFVNVGDDGVRTYDYDTLAYVVKMVTRNLDRVIDVNYYPIDEARNSNLSERPMGIGVQGLADAYIAMRFPYDSPEAAKLNREIFETIYFAALDASCELAEEFGEPYPTFYENGGCPVANGQLQFDMWQAEGRPVMLSGRWDWAALRARIAQHGVRNSLLVALMPTASTSQLLGNNESFEPFTDNMYIRNVLSGSFKVVNRQMILDLIDAGLWTDQIRQKIIALGGSIQEIDEIPRNIRELYKTAYDIKQRVMIDQAADRGPFIDQAHSQNCHMAQPTYAAVTSYHMYAWKRGLKTGLYYLRSKAAKEAVKNDIDPALEREMLAKKNAVAVTEIITAEATAPETNNTDGWVCRKEEGCISCGS